MPEEEKKTVDIDTSGPDAEVSIEEPKEENVVETEQQETETENQEQGTDKTYENERETKLEKKKQDDDHLEEYSKGVQARIAKLTRKMREAERREKAALDYAKAVEEKRKALETKFSKVNEDYVKKFETRVKTGLESAQKELAAAIEAGDAALRLKQIKKLLLYQLMKLDSML